jgi:hypothetical protein
LFRRNVETRQLLSVATGVEERAPGLPGFFEVRRDGELLLKGAAHFADVREADLSGASSHRPGGETIRDAVVMNSLPDPLSSLWILLLMVIAALAWRAQEKGA